MEIKDLGVRGTYRLQNLRNHLWKQGEMLDDACHEIEKIKKYLKLQDAQEHPSKRRRLNEADALKEEQTQHPEAPLPSKASSSATLPLGQEEPGTNLE